MCVCVCVCYAFVCLDNKLYIHQKRLGCVAVAFDHVIFTVTAADEDASPCLILVSKMRKQACF